METNKPVAADFQQELKKVIEQRVFSKIQYRTDLQEFITITSLIREKVTENGEDWVELANGGKIRLDQVVSINGVVAPGYEDYMAISCDC
jgi:hypothetical protein